MAASIVIEEERGTHVGTPRHPHNGYYAGDFRNVHEHESSAKVALCWVTPAPKR